MNGAPQARMAWRGLLRASADRARRLRGELLWVALGQILAFAGMFFGLKLLTSLMGPAGFGELALGMTIAGLVGMVVFAPIGQAVLRFVSIYRERGRLAEFTDLVAKTHILSAIAMAALVAGGGVAGYALGGGDWAALAAASVLFGTIRGWGTTLFSILNALRLRPASALCQAADTWLRPLLAVGAIALVANTGWAAMAAFCIGALLVTAVQLPYTLRRLAAAKSAAPTSTTPPQPMRWRQYPARVREAAVYSGPLVVWSLLGVAAMHGDRWILVGLAGEAKVGIYAALFQIANAPIVLLGGIVGQFVVPIIYDRAGAMTSADRLRQSDRLLAGTVIGFGAMCVAVLGLTWLVSEPLVRVLSTAEFAEFHAMLPILFIGVSIFQIGQLLSLRGFYYNRTGIYLLPKAVHGLSTLTAVYLLARQFGLAGAAWGTVAGAAAYVASVAAANLCLKNKE